MGDGRLLRVPSGDDPGGWRHVALYHANTNAIAAVVDIPDHIRRLQGAGNAWHCCGARRAPIDPHAGTGAKVNGQVKPLGAIPSANGITVSMAPKEYVYVFIGRNQESELLSLTAVSNPAKVEYFKTTSMAVKFHKESAQFTITRTR